MEENSILFVDDQIEILDILKRMLQDEEYDKYFATNAEEAIEILKKKNIDVIVTDMSMPDTNGLEFLKLVKKDYPNATRIVLSAHSHMAIVLEAINKGEIFRFIPKPWKVDKEAKEILWEAINYSKQMINKDLKRFENYIEINKFMDILNIANVDYLWYQKGYLIAGKSYEKILQDKITINELIDGKKYKKIILGNGNTILLKNGE